MRKSIENPRVGKYHRRKTKREDPKISYADQACEILFPSRVRNTQFNKINDPDNTKDADKSKNAVFTTGKKN